VTSASRPFIPVFSCIVVTAASIRDALPIGYKACCLETGTKHAVAVPIVVFPVMACDQSLSHVSSDEFDDDDSVVVTIRGATP
jgi:hypothetical protein